MPFKECLCQPTVRVHKGKTWLIHHAFDKRERWMAVEIMLGMRCNKHLLTIDRALGGCNHIETPPPFHEEDDNEKQPQY